MNILTFLLVKNMIDLDFKWDQSIDIMDNSISETYSGSQRLERH